MSAKTKYAAMSRRAAMTAAAMAAMATLAGCGGSGAGAAATGDMALGAAEGAKVTVVEYASVTCGHCAAWNEQVWPQFKAKYVDTNKVRFVFREFPTPPQDVAGRSRAFRAAVGRRRTPQDFNAGPSAGRIDYAKYRFIDRQVIRFIMWLTKGPTDPRACVEFTDWQRVDEFARRVAVL